MAEKPVKDAAAKSPEDELAKALNTLKVAEGSAPVDQNTAAIAPVAKVSETKQIGEMKVVTY